MAYESSRRSAAKHLGTTAPAQAAIDEQKPEYDPPADVPCRDVNGYLCWTQPIESARVRLLSSLA